MTTIDSAQQKLARLAQEVAQLRQENSHLRRLAPSASSYHYNTSGRILRRALDDATAMLMLAANDYPTSRQFFYDLGYSERRYYWAIGLLRAARIMAPRGRRLADMDFQSAEAKLKSRYENLKNDGDALQVLRLYMPKKMAYTYGSGRKTRDKDS